METVEIGATITREATAADATRVRVRREGRTLIPYCERLIDKTSLQVSACWATSYGLFHCSMLVGMSCWDVLLVRLVCLTGEGLALPRGVGVRVLSMLCRCGIGV